MHPRTQLFAFNVNRRLSALRSLGSALWVLAFASMATAATVTTDKPDYHPGDVVVITGTGWAPGELVDITITEDKCTCVHHWTVIAEPDGTIYDNSFNITLDHLGVTFTLTATGPLSGTATATFTDGPPKIDLDQARNGPGTAPVSPVDFQNGNLGGSQSHYIEGQSVPYRAVMEDMPTNVPITVVIGFDIKHSSRHALDYLTYYDRLQPHSYATHSTQETVDLFEGLTGFPMTFTTFPIPGPATNNTPVPGQPTNSFNALPASERVFTLYGGNISDAVYTQQGDLTAAQSEARVKVTFTLTNSQAILAWGGHIASRNDWGSDGGGVPRSASGISGSPYHMRFVSWGTNADGTVGLPNLGNTDRSLSAGAVLPVCEVTGPGLVCGGSTNEYCAPSGVNYEWTISGNGSISGPTNTQCISVIAGSSGSYTVVVTISSGSLSSICSNTVTVSSGPACSITGLDSVCPSSTHTYSGPAGTGLTYFWSISGDATFASGGPNPTTQDVMVTASSTCGGSFTLTLKLTDANGCMSTCTKLITVQDTTNPTITCPSAVSPIQCPAAPVFPPPTASDLCDPSPAVTFVDSFTPGACPGTGTHTRTWTATDDCGNSASCSQTVVVVDTTPPTITCPATTSPIQCPAAPVFPPPTASDLCDPSPTVTFVDSFTPGACPGTGTHTRTWTATDCSGNSASCSQTVVVVDTTPPTITCPGDITQCNPNVTYVVQASDTCDPTPTVVCSPPAGVFPVGMTTVNCTATDDCGNSASCSFKVTILAPPTAAPLGDITGCPGDIAVFGVAASGAGPFTYSWFILVDGQVTPTALADGDTGVTIISDANAGTSTLTLDTDTALGGLSMGTHAISVLVSGACGEVTAAGELTLVPCNPNCSLTQGFYGSQRGKFTLADGTVVTGVELVADLLNDVDAQRGIPGLLIGKWNGGTGTYLWIAPDQGLCIARRLPSGGPAVPLPPGTHVFGGGENCTTDLPLDKKSLKFRNVLLGQTITLSLNVRLDTTLSPVVLTTNFCTIEAVPLPGGGFGTGDKSTCQSFQIPQSVLTALTTLSLPHTVGGLLELANRGLAGEPTGDASLTDISSAVSAINEGYDECRFLIPCSECN